MARMFLSEVIEDWSSFYMNGLRYVRTSEMCPEKYDVWDEDNCVGTVSYRRGELTASVWSEYVLRESIGGPLESRFDDNDRLDYITMTTKVINNHLRG